MACGYVRVCLCMCKYIASHICRYYSTASMTNLASSTSFTFTLLHTPRCLLCGMYMRLACQCTIVSDDKSKAFYLLFIDKSIDFLFCFKTCFLCINQFLLAFRICCDSSVDLFTFECQRFVCMCVYVCVCYSSGKEFHKLVNFEGCITPQCYIRHPLILLCFEIIILK